MGTKIVGLILLVLGVIFILPGLLGDMSTSFGRFMYSLSPGTRGYLDAKAMFLAFVGLFAIVGGIMFLKK